MGKWSGNISAQRSVLLSEIKTNYIEVWVSAYQHRCHPKGVTPEDSLLGLWSQRLHTVGVTHKPLWVQDKDVQYEEKKAKKLKHLALFHHWRLLSMHCLQNKSLFNSSHVTDGLWCQIILLGKLMHYAFSSSFHLCIEINVCFLSLCNSIMLFLYQFSHSL